MNNPSCLPRKPQRTYDDDEIFSLEKISKPRRRPSKNWGALSKPTLDGNDSNSTELTYADSWSTINDESTTVFEEVQDDPKANALFVQKRVRFSTVEVREYAITIGEHPSCPGPYALQLDWKHAPSCFGSAFDYGMRHRKSRTLATEQRLQRVAHVQGWQHVRLRELQLLLAKVSSSISEEAMSHEFLEVPDFDDLNDACGDLNDQQEEGAEEQGRGEKEPVIFWWRETH